MKAKYSVGDRVKNRLGDYMVIESYVDRFNIKVRFEKTGYTRMTSSSHLSSGHVRDHMLPSVCGVGILGGSYCSGGKPKSYKVWHSMICRCYDEGNSYYHRYGGVGVSVCDDWLFFPNFKSWFDDNYIDGMQIDKDLSGSKVYSPETCVFISRTENTKEMLSRRNPKPFKVKKDGVIYEGDCRKDFIDANGLTQSSFSRLLSGKIKSHKGFVLA
jgi:hypothetical protein